MKGKAGQNVETMVSRPLSPVFGSGSKGQKIRFALFIIVECFSF